jgi:hypothetical protein
MIAALGLVPPHCADGCAACASSASGLGCKVSVRRCTTVRLSLNPQTERQHVMTTSRSLGVLGLVLCAMTVGATSPSGVRHAVAASAEPNVAVAGHLSASLVRASHPERYSTGHQMMLHISGSGFAPGEKVGIAVMSSVRWAVIARGSTYAQRATTSVLCGNDFKLCSRPNPRAGKVNYQIRISSPPHAVLTWICGHEDTVCSRLNPRATSSLLVLYRSRGSSGMLHVALG